MKKSMWKGMLAIVFTLVTICISINAYAALAEPKLQKVYQADGTEITVYSYGDEYFHWVEDEYENVIVYDLQDKNWHYACIENDNIIADTDIVGLENSVCFTNKIKRDDIQYLIEKSIKSNGNNSYNNSSEYSPRINNEQPKTNQELLLLLIEFDNITLMDNKDNGQYWYSQYFSAEKNVAQYYKDMSNGLDIFIPSTTQNIGLSSEITDTVQYQGDDSELNTIFKGEEGVPVTISNAYDGVIKVKFHMEHPIQYRLSGDDTKIEQALVSLALGMIKEKTQYDFAGFGDNKQVSVIVAGGEASASYGRNGQVWSHCGIFDGNVIGLSGECRYILHGELYSPGRELSIGVPCHELGHILGLPDLYNTETDPYGINARNDARNFYSLMGCGNWGAEYGQTGGSTPVSLDAWSKIYLGYIEPIEYDATDYAVASVNSLENVGVGENSSYNVLRLNNVNVDPNQYFLIENRQNSGWDEGMVRFFNGQTSFSGGIVIMQIDEDVIDNYIGENKVNIVNNHRGVDIVGHFGGSSTGHYFYSSDRENMKEFTDSTVPSSKFYDPDDEMTGTQRKSSHINIIIDNNSQAEMSVTLGKDTEITDKIPDNNFLKEIRKAVGKTNEEPIYKSDVMNITKLDVSAKRITSLEGIEYFTGLKEFFCVSNRFKTLDLSKNTRLEILDCSYNVQMTSLNISKNTELKELYCNYARLSSLDITRNKKLIKLICFSNQLNQLDLSANKALENINCSQNYLTTLDISNNPQIKNLDCTNNNFSSVDDVVGWSENGLILETTFKFNPQRNAS